MSRAATSLFVWSIYLAVLGTALLVVPNMLVGLFAVPETREVWIRVVGMLLLFLGYYSLGSARTENKAYMRWSAQVRATVILFFGAFVALGLAPAVLLLFAVVDLAAALWTFWALRRDQAPT